MPGGAAFKEGISMKNGEIGMKVRIAYLRDGVYGEPKTEGSVEYATRGSAAVDLRACIGEPVTIYPVGDNPIGLPTRALIKTGIAIELPECYAALVLARSGLAIKHGISLANGVGLIDSDYRGEVGVELINFGSEPFQVNPGDRVAQLMIVPYERVMFEAVTYEKLGVTERGRGGFGSTGRA